MVESESGRRIGNAIAWCLVPVVGAMQLVNLRRTVPGVEWLPLEGVLLVLVVAVTAPWAWRRRREVSRLGWLVLASFTALTTYSAASVLAHGPPVVHTSADFSVPLAWTLAPPVLGFLTMVAGFGALLSAEARVRPRILLAAGVALLAAGIAAWPRQAAVHRSWRFATAMAGSATIHVALLLVAGVGLAAWTAGRSRVWGLGVFGVAVTAILATQSRAGLLALAAWVFVLLAIRGLRGRQMWIVGGGVLAIGLSLVLIPGLSRALSFSDVKRATNLESALRLWGQDPMTVIFGTGSGQVWPWLAFDTGRIPAPGSGMVPSSAGDLLLSPHSTALAILVELGLVGASLGLLGVGGLCGLLYVSRRDPYRLPVVAAVVSCLVAFLFDTYLVKNFGISFFWWVAIARCAAIALRGPVLDPAAGGTEDD